MTGLLTPVAGEVRLNDVNVRRRLPETLSDFYFIPEEFDLPDYSLEKYVRLHAPFYPKFDHENLRSNLQMFGMTEGIKLGELSMGQKKKVLFCFALATRTSWLIMDEPTNGMDIPGKSQFRKLLIREMNEQRGAVISTHQVKDVEQLLDHIVIIEKGKRSSTPRPRTSAGSCTSLPPPTKKKPDRPISPSPRPMATPPCCPTLTDGNRKWTSSCFSTARWRIRKSSASC